MTCYNEKCKYFSWEYVGNPGRVPACNKNKVLEAFDCSTCGFNPDKMEKDTLSNFENLSHDEQV